MSCGGVGLAGCSSRDAVSCLWNHEGGRLSGSREAGCSKGEVLGSCAVWRASRASCCEEVLVGMPGAWEVFTGTSGFAPVLGYSRPLGNTRK